MNTETIPLPGGYSAEIATDEHPHAGAKLHPMEPGRSLARTPLKIMKTKINIETPSYNDRRYGKPWIASVDFSDVKGNFTFGDFIGGHGSAGLLEIDASPGDIIAQGQKDMRKPSNSAPSFHQVQPDGSLSAEMTKAQALKAWRANQEAPAPENPLAGFSDAEIIAEMTRRKLVTS